MYHIAGNFKKKIFCSALFWGLCLLTPLSNADEATLIAEDTPQLISQAEIQQGLLDVRNKMNTRIETWGATLTRTDFERKKGKLVLKPSKQAEVCQIFQGVIDETYLSSHANKHRLSLDDQKLIESRALFIQALGIENSIIPTKLGFDCRVK